MTTEEISTQSLHEKTKAYILKIEFKTYDLEVAENDIIVFVGSNNVGKSLTLREIYNFISDRKSQLKIINNIKFFYRNINLEDEVKKYSSINEHGTYTGYGFSFSKTLANTIDPIYYKFLCHYFVSYLDTATRLHICKPPNRLNRNENYTHPIHYIANIPEIRKKVSSKFREAFGMDVIPSISERDIPLYLGEQPKLSPSNSEGFQYQLDEYEEILKHYPQAHEQGDGIRSLLGILLHLQIPSYRTYLIDEPESFLHPPQAKILGKMIGETLSSTQQAFLSTHSLDIIKGLLEVCPERVKIVRITRNDNINSFSILKNEEIKNIQNDTLLSHSNILDAIFHTKVVLCESDSDCKMYSIILTHLKKKEGKYNETYFIHCGGKDRIPKIVHALKNLNIDLTIIPDIDLLNNKDKFTELLNELNFNSDDKKLLESYYKKFMEEMGHGKSSTSVSSIKEKINNFFDDFKGENLEKNDLRKLSELLKIPSKWDALKKAGERHLIGETLKSYQKIDKLLQQKQVYLVPEGELENFIREVNKHGPTWVTEVLETYPDLDDPVYDRIKEFVKSWKI